MKPVLATVLAGLAGTLLTTAAWAASAPTEHAPAEHAAEHSDADAPKASQPDTASGAQNIGDADLEQQLEQLSVPANQAPVAGLNPETLTEKLYSLQNRYVPIDDRSELTLGGGKNFNADSFITSGEIDVQYRFHFNDKWHATLGGSYVFNSLDSSGQALLQMDQLLPDVAYVKYRANLLAGYNLFYGKFRLSMDQVFYFDQYIAAGPGVVAMNTGTSAAAVGDVGFVFWIGRKYNAQIGVKDYVYRQIRALSTGTANDLVGHLDIGILLGGGRS